MVAFQFALPRFCIIAIFRHLHHALLERGMTFLVFVRSCICDICKFNFYFISWLQCTAFPSEMNSFRHLQSAYAPRSSFVSRNV